MHIYLLSIFGTSFSLLLSACSVALLVQGRRHAVTNQNKDAQAAALYTYEPVGESQYTRENQYTKYMAM